ncbi:MAG: hypothetical protein NTZ83_04245 [Candidatus Pacearchaeota archaeon]|nr:hypothetical protein [Candidatus Pacearchaeota archaeon]
MHELANEIIEKKNEELIDASIYENQKKINPVGCIHYLENTKCHNIDTKEGKILDCSDCLLPHKRENAIKLLDNLFTKNDTIST